MPTLRSKVIRLAHDNKALRPHLLPLLKEAGRPNPTPNYKGWVPEFQKMMSNLRDELLDWDDSMGKKIWDKLFDEIWDTEKNRQDLKTITRGIEAISADLNLDKVELSQVLEMARGAK